VSDVKTEKLSSVAHGGLGFIVGVVLTLIVVQVLFGAKGSMVSSANGFPATQGGVYYVVGDKRFDWFYPSHGPAGYHPNCWGGHTADGRCISLVSSSGWQHGGEMRFPECVDHPCDKNGFMIATPAAIRQAHECTKRHGGAGVNPLYVEKFGRCPE
jgi:hypothetical protein